MQICVYLDGQRYFLVLKRRGIHQQIDVSSEKRQELS